MLELRGHVLMNEQDVHGAPIAGPVEAPGGARAGSIAQPPTGDVS